jgi:hypothetical protein
MRALLATTLLTLALLPAVAAAQSVTLVCDRPILAVGGTATVEVVVEGGTSIAGNPSFPRSTGFTLAFAGQSSSFQMARGSVSQSITFRYQLVGKTVGTFPIGPAEVSMGGTKLSTAQLEIKIVQGSASNASAPPPPNQQHYARATVSEPAPYVGQSVTWQLEVGSSGRVRQPTLPALPDMGGLSAEPGIEPQWTNQRVMRDGRRVELFTAALPLFAVEPGATTIGAAVVSLPEVVSGGGLFPTMRDLQLEAAAIPLAVRPLPPGRPADFSGAVGSFQLFAGLDSNTVATGETATLTLRLEGKGALRAPEVPVVTPPSVRVYDETPEVQVALVDGVVHSRAVFRKALVPLEPGTLELPPTSFTFFNPETGQYETAYGGKLRLKVTGESVAEPAVSRSEGIAAGKEEVEILAADILPLRTGDRILGSRRVGLGSPLVLGLLLLPLLSFGGVLTWRARAQAADSDRGRKAARSKEARAAEKRAAAAGVAGDADGAESALRDWLTARMHRSGASLSPGEAKQALLDGGAPDDLAGRLAVLLARVEAVRYGGEPAGDLAEALARWVRDADRGWR